MKKMRTLETMMEESNWLSRSRWKARVGYGEGFLESRSLGSSIRGNMVDGGLNEWQRSLRELILLFTTVYIEKKTAASL